MNAYAWFNNGSEVTGLGQVGYTGAQRFNVVYQFTVPSGGASSVTIYLNNFYYFHGSDQSVGCKISSAYNTYRNAGTGISPDGTTRLYWDGTMYSGSITCSVNLPAGTYYATIYDYSGIAGYWSTVYSDSASVSTSGSYTPTEVTPTISSLSSTVETQSNVLLVMTNPSAVSLYAQFVYSGTVLATSGAFTTQLSYTCPRSWFSQNTAVVQMSVSLMIYKSDGTYLTQRSFFLNADSGMKPVLYGLDETTPSFSVTKVNTNGSVDEIISTLTKLEITFSRSNNDYVADMSSTAGATIRDAWIEYKGEKINRASSSSYSCLTGAVTGSGTVRVWMQDSRYRTGYIDYEFTAYAYAAPTIVEASVVRCNSTYPYDPSDTGTAFKVKITRHLTHLGDTTAKTGVTYYSDSDLTNSAGTLSSDTPCTVVNDYYSEVEVSGTTYYVYTTAVSSKNGYYRVYTYYKETSDSEYTLVGLGASTYKNYTTYALNQLDTSKTYMVKIGVQDKAGGYSEYEYYLSFEQWMICWTSTGNGCGIGQAPGGDNMLQIPQGWDYISGTAKFGNEHMVLVSGKHYGTQAQMEAISSPATGQVFYVLTS